MKYILFNRIMVQNANAISGLTWGFPAITHFLGFTHSLSRKLSRSEFHDLSFGGCGVICHDHKVQTFGPSYDIKFTQNRNPAYLKKDVSNLEKGKAPSVIEEGKMNMTVSLLLGYEGNVGNRRSAFLDWLKKQCLLQRLAGGTILSVGATEFFGEDDDSVRQIRFRLLPGFVLLDRSRELEEHCNSLERQDPSAEMLDAWLDFAALKQKARPKSDLISAHLHRLAPAGPNNNCSSELYSVWEKHLASPYSEGEAPKQLVEYFDALEPTEENKALLEQWKNYRTPTEESAADWEFIPKPAPGYLVPIMTGYKAISKVYPNNEVKNTRDNETDVCFVEATHSVGEWQSVHRLKDADELRKCLWHYHYEDSWYLCRQESGGAMKDEQGASGNELLIHQEEDYS